MDFDTSFVIDVLVIVASSLSVTAAVAGIVSLISRRRMRLRFGETLARIEVEAAEQDALSPLERNLAEAVRASHELVRITFEITTELNKQAAETDRLASEAAETRAFMTANEEVVVAMRAMLRSELREELKSELEKQGKSDRRFQIGLSVISFLVGIAATVLFQVIGNAVVAG